MKKEKVMENTMMENIQLRSEQELDQMNITIQADVHHALELMQKNAPKLDTIVLVENGNNDVIMMEKDDIMMKAREMVNDNKDVSDIKKDTKFVVEKEKEGDSSCVTEEGKMVSP